MTGGMLQLVAQGNENLYLTFNPQITYFKVVYKRHTNFSYESVRQNFNSKPEFNKKITCTIGKNADLIHKLYVVVNLPKINVNSESNELSNLNKCAWIENIGWHIIKSVEIEIGGYVIDRHYGDWLYIWSTLTYKSGLKRGLDKMIGNVPELTEYTTKKDDYLLYIPLSFWFCKNPGLALPIVALEFSDVKINVEFASINDVLLLSPTHYIDIENNFVHFSPGDMLYQQIGNKKTFMKFVHFENRNDNIHRLYYNKISNDNIIGYSNENLKQKYKIYSLDGIFDVDPAQKSTELKHINKQNNFEWVNSLFIKEAYLLVDYIYLDIDERIKYIKSSHEYLIEVLMYDNERNITNNSNKFNFGYSNPCKEFIFRAQMDYLVENNVLQKSNYCLDYDKQKNIINNIGIFMNGISRITSRQSEYFHNVQSLQYHSNKGVPGLYSYSFSLFPENSSQPSGSCNLSKMDEISIEIKVDKEINYLNPAKFRLYGLCLNVLRIIDGQCGLAFSN